MAEGGDSYPQECEATTAALQRRLAIPDGGVVRTYQSKFVPAPWLTPATIDTVTTLGALGTDRVDVICPGLVSDCLETLEEAVVDVGLEASKYLGRCRGGGRGVG